MRTPIAHALAHPDRIEAGVKRLDLAAVSRLTFERPDLKRFPCLGLAYSALEAGGTAPAILNAANEVAVAAFLDGRLGYGGIAAVIGEVLEALPPGRAETLDQVLAADGAARRAADAGVARRGRK
jgi:1-deoxy-D-xylulose-5-phosphate reductoisomerase